MKDDSKKSFSDKFNDLTDQMTELVKTASDADLAQAGIKRVKLSYKEAPVIKMEPADHKEFMEQLVYRLTGNKTTYIIQKADELESSDLSPYLDEKRPILVPSVIRPSGSLITFNPYITFFTIDGKLAMLPYDGEFFSDLTTRVGKIDPTHYRRG